MLKKNVEIFHQGYLVKSPPSHRGGLLFKARWRRRFFTLKQGELPAQYFLEYFTDESCRKRKGTIDLDQVEQIDAGLRLDKQSVKFQHIFDMKTPHRTYYLAADTEKDMRDWVMVICQVCNLQEADDKGNESTTVQYYNLISHPDFEAKEVVARKEDSYGTNSTTLSTSNNNNEQSQVSSRFDNMSIVNEYENDNFAVDHQSAAGNRSSIYGGSGQNYSNLSAIQTLERSKQTINKSTGAIKKIPKNLDLMKDDKINNNNQDDNNCFRTSNPYIPLSDCYSGSPILFKNEGDPKTPLNSLDPKFYETPKSHQTNIGLNLTDDQKDSIPNSPKRSNVATNNVIGQNNERSVNSSPTDDGFSSDDDEEWKKFGDNRKVSSDNSTEDVAIIAEQCYTKIPGAGGSNPLPLPPKRMSLVLEKKTEISDTEENISPIGPKDMSSVVDEQYDIPRSYNLPPKTDMNSHYRGGYLMTSTPNLLSSPNAAKFDRNFYSNAAPSENNVFRFDMDSNSPPEVNRFLKPGKNSNSTNSLNAPKVDRKLKPSSRANIDQLITHEFDETSTLNGSMISQISREPNNTSLLKNDEKLQYLDLVHESPPKSSFIGSVASIASSHHTTLMDTSINGSIKENPGINYTTVDFVKTDAFNRLREDSENIRASKSKHKK